MGKNGSNHLQFDMKWTILWLDVGKSGLMWMIERRFSGVCPLNPKVEHMFLGQFYHTLDEKGRITIPASFRELLLDGAYVTQGFDQNLRLLTTPAFNDKASNVNRHSDTNPRTRKLRRLYFGNAAKVDLDRLGRILIPNFLREFAKLEKEAVIVGVGDAAEIWSPIYWQEQVDDISDTNANADQFEDLEI